MLKRIAGACVDRRNRLLTDAGAAAESSSNKPVVDGGDRVVGGASTVQDEEDAVDRMESSQQAAMQHPSSPTKSKGRFDIKALMRGHSQGTKKARFCLMSVPVVMILIMITRPLYAPLIDVFGDDVYDAEASGMDSSVDVNPVSMDMGLVREHWPLVHGKKHGKIPGKKGQAKHTYGGGSLSGGGGGGDRSGGGRRSLMARGGGVDDDGELPRRGGGLREVGGGDGGVTMEWSAPGADATSPPLA